MTAIICMYKLNNSAFIYNILFVCVCVCVKNVTHYYRMTLQIFNKIFFYFQQFQQVQVIHYNIRI